MLKPFPDSSSDASGSDVLSAKILLLDDREENVALLHEILRGAGYVNVKGIIDSREAVAVYKEFSPDLLILDLNMPYLDGFEVMERLREIDRSDYLPILILTAEQDAVTRQRALKSGARDFLTKPFEPLEALARIWNLLEVRLLHNRLRDQNKILEEAVRERTRELWQSRLDIIHRLSLAAEYRDDFTGVHLKQMSAYAVALAKAAGLDERELELLGHASQMHDIGKIRIPDQILLKPGKLSPEEWEIIKTHPAIGGEILAGSDSPLLQMAERIALTHHEKWDGSGYPKGLKKEKIPLEGRICAIADVFDALTSDRPYKKAWPLERAMDEIERGAGSHFDPELVPLFKENLAAMISIRERQGA